MTIISTKQTLTNKSKANQPLRKKKFNTQEKKNKQKLTHENKHKKTDIKGFKDFCAKGDSKLIIDSILNKYKTPWHKTIIENIRLLARSFPSISWDFLADVIASVGHSILDTLFGIGLTHYC